MKRDKNLDGLKGIACILMIFAHAHGFGKTTDNWITIFIYQIGLFAPVLFLSSIGISLVHQVKIKPKHTIIAGYVLLFIVSFANMGLRLGYKEYLTLSDGNLYASIALSAMITLVLFKYVDWFTILVPAILLYFLNKSAIDISLFYGGIFSIVPWIVFTLVGLYLHHHKHFVKVVCLAMLMLTFYLFSMNRFGPFDEYNTPLYFSVGLLLYTFFYIITPFLLRIKSLTKLLLYLGHNSLLFYVIHRIIVIYFPFRLFAPIMWVFIFIATILLMQLFTKINSLLLQKYSDKYFFWALLFLALCIPSVISMNIYSQRVIMLSVMIVHALNYHNFANLRIFKTIPLLKKNSKYDSK